MTIARKAVVDGILRGIASANSRFEEWSRGAWIPDYGIEGFMVAHIAAALRKKQNASESLLIEAPFEEIRECSGASRSPGRRRKVLQGKRRADIALFDRQYRSVYVIEAKRKWDRSTCFRDIERLRALLDLCAKQKNGTLKAGFLCLPIVEWGYTRTDVKQKVDRKMCRIREDVSESFCIGHPKMQSWQGPMRWYPEQYCDGEEWGTAAFCMAFSP